MKSILEQCKAAYDCCTELGISAATKKNKAIRNMATALRQNKENILKANQVDVEAGKEAGLSASLLDRLLLTEARIEGMATSLETIEMLKDPIGEIITGWVQPNGLKIRKTRVPLGVIGIIYEARPNVTADAIGLAIKTGNSVVLRGSSSAYQSNLAIATVMRNALDAAGLPIHAIQLLEDTSREGVKTFVTASDYLSVIIPRGGAGLIQSVIQTATVPTIETGVGNCHIFIDETADIEAAIDIVENAKVQRPSVCNACETILVHEKVAKIVLPDLIKRLRGKGVMLAGCDKTCAFDNAILSATEEDWATEYLDLKLAVKVVKDVDEAIRHIKKYGTHHSEAILSQTLSSIKKFEAQIDAAAILINASTRFTDGGEFGFGAELGISTQKLHARGPMGLAELTTWKYIVEGNNHIRG